MQRLNWLPDVKTIASGSGQAKPLLRERSFNPAAVVEHGNRWR